jgi:2-polyprenyl-3-methyl-5-hydroxy-6-metoxy-1,4-benzoquinol methylase
MHRFRDYQRVSSVYLDLNWVGRVYAFFRFLICPFGIIESLLPKSGKFLDIGCGHGLFANLLALRAVDRKVMGCDLNPDRIRAARRSTQGRENITFFLVDVKQLEIPSCDVITMVDLLHPLSPSDQCSVLRDAAVKLKPGGVLLIKDIDRTPYLKFLWNYLHDLIFTFGGPLNYVEKNKLLHFLEHRGFHAQLMPLETLTPYPHILFLRTKSQNDHVSFDGCCPGNIDDKSCN